MSNFTEALKDAGRSLVGVQHYLLSGPRVGSRRVPSLFASRILEVEPLLVMPSLVRGPQSTVRGDHVGGQRARSIRATSRREAHRPGRTVA